MTLRELAEQLGIRPQVLLNVVNNRTASWPRLRRQVAELFQVDEAELFPDAAALSDHAPAPSGAVA